MGYSNDYDQLEIRRSVKFKFFFFTLLLSILFLYFVLVIFSGVFFFPLVKFWKSKEIRSFKEYKITKINPQTNETILGFANTLHHLEIDDYLSYESENGNLILISHIGSTSYECFGKCTCGHVEDDLEPSSKEERRNGVTIISRFGIRYLLTASSLILASVLASRYFEEECFEKMKGDSQCTVEFSSEFEKCEVIEVDFSRKKVIDRRIRDFLCSGKCENYALSLLSSNEENEVGEVLLFEEDENISLDKEISDKISKQTHLSFKKIAEYDCSKLSFEGEVRVDMDKAFFLPTVIRLQTEEEIVGLARNDFSSGSLNSFCVKNSQIELTEWVTNPETGEDKIVSKPFTHCVGTTSFLMEGGNPTVHCESIKSMGDD